MLDDYFKSLNDLYSKPSELAAIWLTKPVMTSEKLTVRIEPEMLVRIENNELVDCSAVLPATHKIIGCYGTLINQFEIAVMDITNNNDLSIIKL